MGTADGNAGRLSIRPPSWGRWRDSVAATGCSEPTSAKWLRLPSGRLRSDKPGLIAPPFIHHRAEARLTAATHATENRSVMLLTGAVNASRTSHRLINNKSSKRGNNRHGWSCSPEHRRCGPPTSAPPPQPLQSGTTPTGATQGPGRLQREAQEERLKVLHERNLPRSTRTFSESRTAPQRSSRCPPSLPQARRPA